MFSHSERVAREQLFLGLPLHVGFDPHYQADVELIKMKAVMISAVTVFQPPLTLAVPDAMEKGASGTSSVSLIEAPTGVRR